MACASIHPDLPDVRCIAPDTHPNHDRHFAMHEGEPQEWDNVAYVAPAPKPMGRAAAAERLKTLADQVPPSAVVLRGRAIKSVDANSSDEFKRAARDGLARVAEAQAELTSEDVQDSIGMEAHDNRAWGAIMLWGVRNGLIEKTSPEKFVQSRYPRRHLMDVRVWRSSIYTG